MYEGRRLESPPPPPQRHHHRSAAHAHACRPAGCSLACGRPRVGADAFCYVAIYGQDFYGAGRSVFSLFEHKGLATLINDDVTSIIVTMSVFIGAALGALVTGLIALVALGPQAAILCALGGALVSGGLVFLVMSTIDSCVATLFVCFAEDPAALNVTAPDAFAALSVAWAQRYPDFSMAHIHGPY